MRFLFICPAFPPSKNAIGEYVLNLSSSLLSNNHQVVVLTSLIDQENYLNPKIIYHSIQDNSFIDNQCINVLPFIKLWSKNLGEYLPKVLTSYEPDIISLQYEPYSYHKKGLPFFLINELKNITTNCVTITFHEVYSRNYLFGNIFNYFIAGFQKLIAKKLAYNAVISFTALDLYAKALSLENKVCKLFIGSNINVQPNYTIVNPINFSNREITIICFGNKNFKPILSVGEYLKKYELDFSITIVGDLSDEHKYFLKNEILRLSLQSNVFVLGYCNEEQVAFLFKKNDFFIDTNYLDKKKHGGTSLKSGSLATAIKYGKVIIGFKGDMTDSLLEHGNNIWFCEDSSPIHIASSIKELHTNQSLMLQIQNNTLKFYFDYLDWDVISNNFINKIFHKIT